MFFYFVSLVNPLPQKNVHEIIFRLPSEIILESQTTDCLLRKRDTLQKEICPMLMQICSDLSCSSRKYCLLIIKPERKSPSDAETRCL